MYCNNQILKNHIKYNICTCYESDVSRWSRNYKYELQIIITRKTIVVYFFFLT